MSHYKRFFTFALFFFLLKNVQSQTILEIQKKRFEATVKQDSVALSSLISNDLYYIHSNGLIENKAQHIQAILNKKIVYQSFEYQGEPSILQLKKIQIINGKVLVKGLYTGNPFSLNLIFTAVYESRKNKWQLLRWQSTKQ
jgi:Domain of unknown function (DUF4440)